MRGMHTSNPEAELSPRPEAGTDTSRQLNITMMGLGDLNQTNPMVTMTGHNIYNNDDHECSDATRHAPQTHTGRNKSLVGLRSEDTIDDEISAALRCFRGEVDSVSHLPQPKAGTIPREGGLTPTQDGTFDQYDIGEFTSDLDWLDKVPNCSTIVTDVAFGPTSREYWGGLLALTMLDMSEPTEDTLRLDMRMHSFLRNRFKLKMRTWHNTILYNVGVNWIRFPSDDTSFNFGIFTRAGGDLPSFKDIVVPGFDDNTVTAAGKVFVALCGFDVHLRWRLSATATNISQRGFRVNINLIDPKPKDGKPSRVTSSQDTEPDPGALYSAKALWIATTRPNVFVGEFEGNSNAWEGYVHFPTHDYQNPPALFTGISHFELDAQVRFRVKVATVPFTAGFTWSIKSWSGSTLIKVKVQYLAIF